MIGGGWMKWNLTGYWRNEMNRKEFQSWLEQFPEDTEIQVGIQQSPPDYCPYGSVYFDKFKGEHFDDYWYTDYTDNPHTKEGSYYYNKKVLRLGDSK